MVINICSFEAFSDGQFACRRRWPHKSAWLERTVNLTVLFTKLRDFLPPVGMFFKDRSPIHGLKGFFPFHWNDTSRSREAMRPVACCAVNETCRHFFFGRKRR